MSLCFNATATTEIYTLSLHDALPIYPQPDDAGPGGRGGRPRPRRRAGGGQGPGVGRGRLRSEEHTSELQSHSDLVCRLLLEKKKGITPRARDGARPAKGAHEWTRTIR